MSFTYAVNCSILYTELPIPERAAAAAADGFTAVEYWWPFPDAVPENDEVDAFVESVSDAGVALIGLNFCAGDMPGGERGLVQIPSRREEFRESIGVAVTIAERLGCRAFNALYGNTPEGEDPAVLGELALDNLRFAADAVDRIGGRVLIEPLSGAPAYPLKTADEAVAVVEKARAAGSANVDFLFDAYHLAANGDDVMAALARHYDLMGHVQIADNPGRGEPGTGSLDLGGILADLRQRGWDRSVALEYKPTTDTTPASFGWLPREQRGPGLG